MQNVHGKFKGLMLMDHLDHLNANVVLLGAGAAFAPANESNALGNGDAYIRFSSAALAQLPLVGEMKVRIKCWHRAVAVARARAVLIRVVFGSSAHLRHRESLAHPLLPSRFIAVDGGFAVTP